MIELSLTEARAQLPTLLHRVEEGETVHISRHGRPVAVLVGHDEWVRTKRIDILERARATGDWLDGLRAADAVHLATAVVWGAERLHTNNRRDFAPGIREIEIMLPPEPSENA